MRHTASLLVLAAGCGFEPGRAPRDGRVSDTVVIDAPGDVATTDVPLDAPGLCGGKVWFADFSSDPTTYDNNGDGVLDFRSRGAAFQTSQLMSGEWRVPSAGIPPLDMQPVQPFMTRTLVHARMRGTATAGSHGGVFYINFAITGTSYCALFADAHLTAANQQEVNFVNPIAGSGDLALDTVTGFDGSPIDIELDIEPSVPSFTYRINGTPGGPIGVNPSTGTTAAGFGTLTGYSTAAAFDELRVEVCP